MKNPILESRSWVKHITFYIKLYLVFHSSLKSQICIEMEIWKEHFNIDVLKTYL